VSLKWTASTDTGGSGVANYDVFRSRTSGGFYTRVATTGSTSLVNTGLSSGATYWYYLKARDGAGNLSAASVKVSVRAK
jgi:chitodextrinase